MRSPNSLSDGSVFLLLTRFDRGKCREKDDYSSTDYNPYFRLAGLLLSGDKCNPTIVMRPQTFPFLIRHPRLKFTLLCAALAAAFSPHPAVAKLGEDMPALIRRFGSIYQATKPGRWADEAYKFVSKNCQVEVTIKAGHSVAEYYFCYKPLVDGKPPASIWQGIRLKNAPGAKWKPDGHGGLVSADGHFTTWYSTENLPEQSTCAIGINDYYTMKEGQYATVSPLPSTTPVAEKADSRSNTAAVTVVSQIIKRVQMPGAIYGTTSGFRYFFAIRNLGKTAFAGRVTIRVQRREGATNRSETFTVTLPPSGSSNVYVDAYTGPEPFGGDFSISGFSFVVDDGPPSSQTPLSTRFEDMTVYQ